MDSKYFYVILYFSALAIRLFYVATLHGDVSFLAEDDSTLYWSLSGDIINTLATHTLRPPGYPLFLWGLRLIDDSPRFIAVVQAFIDAGTCVIIAALGMFFSKRIAVIAGILAACSASFVIYSAQMLSDTVTMFLQSAAFLTLAHYLQRPNLRTSAWTGVIAGIGILFRPSVLLLLPFFGIVIGARSRSAIALFVFAVLSAIPITPVILRNYVLFDRLALSTIGGIQLTDGIDPLARQRQDGTPYWITRERNAAKVADAVSADPEKYKNPFAIDDLRIKIATDDMTTISLGTFVLVWAEGAVLTLTAPATIGDPRVRQIKDKPSFFSTEGKSFWTRAADYLRASSPTYLSMLGLGAVWSLSTIVLAAVGVFSMVRVDCKIAALLCLPIAYTLAISGPIASAKYRLPMESCLIILASMGIATLRDRLNRRKFVMQTA